MRQALELALEWIKKQPEETPESKYDVDTRYVVLRELEAALAQPEQEGGVCGRCGGWVSDPVITQPEQEPVALQYPQKDIDWQREQQIKAQASTPPQRKPLSDEEMKKIWYAMQNIMGWYSFQEIARAIEAAHGIKG